MPSHSQTRVLYVDDHDDSREMLCTLLALSEIDVIAVATAESALSLISGESFDLYLLDSWLTDRDGYELCRMMRKTNPNTPVLFFSGAAYENDKRRAIDAGASAYVCKPDLDDLLGSINRLAPGKTVAA